MMRERIRQCAAVALLAALCWADASRGQRSRRSQRVRMEEVHVTSPDGKVKLTLAPNAERARTAK